jgi:hypothetical protein
MIKIHDKLWYVITTDEDSNLAYMTHLGKDAAFEKRKDTGERWAKGGRYYYNRNLPTKTPQSFECDNGPLTGFIISESVSRWSTSNKLFRVIDPRGFVVEVPTGNISTLLKYTTVIHGTVQEPCVWGREGNNHILLPEGSEPYNLSLKQSKMSAAAVNVSQVPRNSIVKLTADGDNYIYLGKGKITWKVDMFLKERHSTYWNRHDKGRADPKYIDTRIVEDSKYTHFFKHDNLKRSDWIDTYYTKKVIPSGKISIEKHDVMDSTYYCPSKITQTEVDNLYNTTPINSNEYFAASGKLHSIKMWGG